jgi:hypothetical protein
MFGATVLTPVADPVDVSQTPKLIITAVTLITGSGT